MSIFLAKFQDNWHLAHRNQCFHRNITLRIYMLRLSGNVTKEIRQQESLAVCLSFCLSISPYIHLPVYLKEWEGTVRKSCLIGIYFYLFESSCLLSFDLWHNSSLRETSPYPVNHKQQRKWKSLESDMQSKTTTKNSTLVFFESLPLHNRPTVWYFKYQSNYGITLPENDRVASGCA